MSCHLADEPGGGESHEEDYDPDFIQQVASVLNLDAFDPASRADLLALMRGRFNPRSSGPRAQERLQPTAARRAVSPVRLKEAAVSERLVWHPDSRRGT